MASTTPRRYSLDECRAVLRWYATDDPRLSRATGVAERRAVLERLGWVRCTRVQRQHRDGVWRLAIVDIEVTPAGQAAVTPHPYDPPPGQHPRPAMPGYDPCRVCGDVLRAAIHTAGATP